jgi:hypothetical protein
MCRTSVCVSLLCATLIAQHQPATNRPAQNQKSAPALSLLDKLYRLVWPAGRFQGDLVRTVAKNTEKGTTAPDNPQLYLVDAGKFTAAIWKAGAGASEPVVCAADRTLFYRRMGRIVAEPLRIDRGRIEPSGPAVELSAVAGSLVACTAAADASVLWLLSPEGGLVRLLRHGAALVPAGQVGDDAEFGSVPPRTLADSLRVMRALRPDGFTAAVINQTLVGQKPGKDPFLIVDSDSLQFSGSPAWVPDTDSLFVTGTKEGPQ